MTLILPGSALHRAPWRGLTTTLLTATAKRADCFA